MRPHLLISIVLAAGCADATSAGPSNAPSDDEVFTRTMVHVRPDGNHEVTTTTVTARQQRAEREAREALAAGSTDGVGELQAAIGTDGCNGYDFRLYDRTWRSGNEICFIGQGQVFLDDYVHGYQCDASGCYLLSWAKAVRSWETSDYRWFGDWGWMHGEISYGVFCRTPNFSPYDHQDYLYPYDYQYDPRGCAYYATSLILDQ